MDSGLFSASHQSVQLSANGSLLSKSKRCMLPLKDFGVTQS